MKVHSRNAAGRWWLVALCLQVLALAGASAASAAASAAEINVMSSGAFTAAYRELAPLYEAATGHRINSAFGASMGNAPDAIPVRLKRGEPADIVILAGPALDDLVRQGLVVPGSRVDLVRSAIGAVVRAGQPKPDISTVDALRSTLLQARSVAYSASASGVYISTELFPKLGIAEQMATRARRIDSERVGTVVARGDADLGFQQVSELLPIPGLTYLGLLPEEVQRVTYFSAGISTSAREPELAARLIRFLASPAASPIVGRTGLESLARPGKP